ncbi:MAG: DUF3299 domain-containing protein [Phycisphaerales bacterium]|nr:DUF3299 domain-containing protein [Planctomycetota bacterium]
MNPIRPLAGLLLVACGLAMDVAAGDTPPAPTPSTAPAEAPPPAGAGKALVVPAKQDPKAAAKTETSKDGAKKAKEEPTAPSLPPGEVGTIDGLKKNFPNLAASAKPDGTMVLEDRFALKGKGTQDDPFVVTWDQLTSTSEVYDPRKGQKKIPDRVQMLDGQYVTVTGYVAFPIYVREPKEMLSMLNQWDGCCIGTPPTPYDAIEVHLKEAATKEQRMATYGTVSGRLSVKPYLVGDWLVGLYVMDDAVVSKPKQTGSGS